MFRISFQHNCHEASHRERYASKNVTYVYFIKICHYEKSNNRYGDPCFGGMADLIFILHVKTNCDLGGFRILGNKC